VVLHSRPDSTADTLLPSPWPESPASTAGRAIAASVLRPRVVAAIKVIVAEIPGLTGNDRLPAAGTSHATSRHPPRPASPDLLVSGAVAALAGVTAHLGRPATSRANPLQRPRSPNPRAARPAQVERQTRASPHPKDVDSRTPRGLA